MVFRGHMKAPRVLGCWGGHCVFSPLTGGTLPRNSLCGTTGWSQRCPKCGCCYWHSTPKQPRSAWYMCCASIATIHFCLKPNPVYVSLTRGSRLWKKVVRCHVFFFTFSPQGKPRVSSSASARPFAVNTHGCSIPWLRVSLKWWDNMHDWRHRAV